MRRIRIIFFLEKNERNSTNGDAENNRKCEKHETHFLPQGRFQQGVAARPMRKLRLEIHEFPRALFGPRRILFYFPPRGNTTKFLAVKAHREGKQALAG